MNAHIKKTKPWLLAAAFAAIALVTAVHTRAQYRTGDDGHALDANNRVGSGGYNDDRNNNHNSQRYTGNQVVTGNVTGGKAFRGNISYRDPNDFRGSTGYENSDRFIRNSGGVPTRSNPDPLTASESAAYYGEARATPPPPGFERTSGYTGGFVASRNFNPNGGIDARLRSSLALNENPLITEPDMVLRGPSDQANQQTLLTASPLYGMRRWTVTEGEDNYYLSRLLNGQPQGSIDRFGVNDETVQKLRQELNDSVNGNGDKERQKDAAAAEQRSEAIGQNPLISSANLSNGSNLPNNPLQSALPAPALSGVGAGESSRQTLLGSPDPAAMSSQYAELQRRMDRGEIPAPQSDQEAARQFKMLKTAKEKQASEPGAGEPGKRTVAPAPGPSSRPSTRPAEPLQVESLSSGIKAQGLAELMKSAEALSKEGKYATALEKYAAAERVAPNNPLIRLGRAHVELGAGYYAAAEADLRGAVARNPALLMGRYDLKSFISEQRLGAIEEELKNLSKSEPMQVRAPLLLAYISYNTGDSAQAASYLSEAEKRAGKDSVITLMRRHWSLSGSTPPLPDANK